MNKEENFKEKFKQALKSTIRVISDDYKPNFDKKTIEPKKIKNTNRLRKSKRNGAF